jgi:hypothetical protein
MRTYRVHDSTGDDLGVIEHPAPNVESGDLVVLASGREALVTCRVETYRVGPLAALLEVAVAPSRLTSDESNRRSHHSGQKTCRSPPQALCAGLGLIDSDCVKP